MATFRSNGETGDEIPERLSPERLPETDFIDLTRDADLLAIAAHEMATPLTVLMGLAMTLREHGRDMSDDQLDDVFDAMTRHGSRLSSLFDNVIAISQLQSGPAKG